MYICAYVQGKVKSSSVGTNFQVKLESNSPVCPGGGGGGGGGGGATHS